MFCLVFACLLVVLAKARLPRSAPGPSCQTYIPLPCSALGPVLSGLRSPVRHQPGPVLPGLHLPPHCARTSFDSPAGDRPAPGVLSNRTSTGPACFCHGQHVAPSCLTCIPLPCWAPGPVLAGLSIPALAVLVDGQGSESVHGRDTLDHSGSHHSRLYFCLPPPGSCLTN